MCKLKNHFVESLKNKTQQSDQNHSDDSFWQSEIWQADISLKYGYIWTTTYLVLMYKTKV